MQHSFAGMTFYRMPELGVSEHLAEVDNEWPERGVI
jgi:hypothetical protein